MRCLPLLPLLLSAARLHAQIQDNSFLIEEAYNQEAGVVQHISTFARSEGGAWLYSFTQEWPLGGIAHQLSYSVAVADPGAGVGAGLGDVALNYRHQLTGDPAARLLVAPRLSLLVPTGSNTAGRGTGALGMQANLPVSAVLARMLVAHANVGATLFPAARGPLETRATTSAVALGGSAVWLARPWINLLVEGVWLSESEATGEGITARAERAFLNPGVRWAFDVGSVQVVPGLAYTVGVGPSRGDDALFVYFSLEHAFKQR
jgi:hypothetical protein